MRNKIFEEKTSLQIELASPILTKLLYRAKWELVSKGPIVSFCIRKGEEKKLSLDNGGKITYSVITLTAMGFSAALYVVLI